MFNLRKVLLATLIVAMLLGFLMGSIVEAIKVIQVAGVAKTLDPSRLSDGTPQGMELAGGAKALDPTGRIQG